MLLYLGPDLQIHGSSQTFVSVFCRTSLMNRRRLSLLRCLIARQQLLICSKIVRCNVIKFNTMKLSSFDVPSQAILCFWGLISDSNALGSSISFWCHVRSCWPCLGLHACSSNNIPRSARSLAIRLYEPPPTSFVSLSFEGRYWKNILSSCTENTNLQRTWSLDLLP